MLCLRNQKQFCVKVLNLWRTDDHKKDNVLSISLFFWYLFLDEHFLLSFFCVELMSTSLVCLYICNDVVLSLPLNYFTQIFLFPIELMNRLRVVKFTMIFQQILFFFLILFKLNVSHCRFHGGVAASTMAAAMAALISSFNFCFLSIFLFKDYKRKILNVFFIEVKESFGV